jgi:hypothetical protein
MSIHDEMSDHDVLRAAADSLSGLPIARPPDLESIMARGHAHRARRARRLTAAASLSAAGAAASTALAIGLTSALSPAPAPAPVPPPSPGTGTGTGPIRTAAFTLASNPDGTATLTINAGELLDTATLQRDLAQYGIPAKVTSGKFCSSDPAPDGFKRAVQLYGPWVRMTPSGPGKPPPDQSTLSITIDPAAIPAGTALSIGDFQLGPDQQQADLALIDTSSSTCSSTPPGPDGPPGGTQIIFGGSGQAGS